MCFPELLKCLYRPCSNTVKEAAAPRASAVWIKTFTKKGDKDEVQFGKILVYWQDLIFGFTDRFLRRCGLVGFLPIERAAKLIFYPFPCPLAVSDAGAVFFCAPGARRRRHHLRR